MEFKKNEQLVFRLILGSFCLSPLILLIFMLQAPDLETAERRTWVSRLEGSGVVPLLIGEPSGGAASSEIISSAPIREDVALPDAESSFFTIDFSPTADGFSFQNYGTRFPQGDLSIDEVHELFGDRVCVGGEGENCLPTPSAHMWIDTMNNYMAAGHCAGFTVLSNRFYTGQIDQTFYTSYAEKTFDIEQSVPVMRQISKDWVLQVTEEVWSARVDGSPREVIDALLEIKEPVDLGIFGRNGGGALPTGLRRRRQRGRLFPYFSLRQQLAWERAICRGRLSGKHVDLFASRR